MNQKKYRRIFTIRFDGKGYRVYTLEDLLLHFQQAKEVERIIFSLETGQSILTNRNTGTVMELRLDQKNPNSCTVLVTSDDRDWVDASFAAIQDILSK
jgi:DNA-binding transcriptional MerR regulator